MQPNEHIVRQFAHQIWESEGRPEGQASRHWEMACKLAAEEDIGPADPFEPLTNINTYAPTAEREPAKRARAKSLIDDPDAAPQKIPARPGKKARS